MIKMIRCWNECQGYGGVSYVKNGRCDGCGAEVWGISPFEEQCPKCKSIDTTATIMEWPTSHHGGSLGGELKCNSCGINAYVNWNKYLNEGGNLWQDEFKRIVEAQKKVYALEEKRALNIIRGRKQTT